jgi:hypothetical protein
MEHALIYIIPISIVLGFYAYQRNYTRQQKKLMKDSLDDESIFVEGIGKVDFEDIKNIPAHEMDEQDNSTGIPLFRDDLMDLEGEFLIKDVPLNEERRLSIDDAFAYLQELFGKDILKNKPVRTIDDPLLSIKVKYTEDIYELAQNIAQIMDIAPEKIVLDFFNENEYHEAAGLYKGKDDEGFYHVALLNSIYTDVEKLIAVIAHEFAHIKLLGEERMEENAEELTDMVTLFYGLGIFNSNVVFRQQGDHVEKNWTTSRTGYLSLADWGYLFALYKYVGDDKETAWFKYLNKTIARDAELSYEFMLANPDKVLQVA